MGYRDLTAALAFLVLTTSSAWAQDAQDKDARGTLQRKTRPGDLLTIDVRKLGPVEGQLVRLDPDAVHIEFGRGTREIAYSDIDRVRRRRNGIVLGTAIGAGFGLGYGTFIAMIMLYTEGGTTGDAVRVVATFAATTTAVGAAIDAALSVNRTIYRRSNINVRVEVAPRPKGAAAGLRVSW
jgi:hypothetical protein